MKKNNYKKSNRKDEYEDTNKSKVSLKRKINNTEIITELCPSNNNSLPSAVYDAMWRNTYSF